MREVEVGDTEGMSPLDVMKMMYDGDIPGDEVTDTVSKHSKELVTLLVYAIDGWESGWASDTGMVFSVAATALAFALGVIAGREDRHD